MTNTPLRECGPAVVAFVDAHEAAQKLWAKKYNIGARDIDAEWEKVSMKGKVTLVEYILVALTDDSDSFPMEPLITYYEHAREQFRADRHLRTDQLSYLWLAERPDYRAHMMFRVMESLMSHEDLLPFIKKTEVRAPGMATSRP